MMDYDTAMIRDFFDQIRIEVARETSRAETGEITDFHDVGRLSPDDKIKLREIQERRGDNGQLVPQNVIKDHDSVVDIYAEQSVDSKSKVAINELRCRILGELRLTVIAMETLLPTIETALKLIEGDNPVRTWQAAPQDAGDESIKFTSE